MKRLILHWTAGGPVPTSYEKECYHFLVDGIGKIHKGRFKPEANLICRKGMYAAHTGGGNTGAVGVSFCAMAGFKNKNCVGHFPINKTQFEAGMKLCAELCLNYSITPSCDNVMTHYEFGLKNPKTTSAGKIDIIHIPAYPWVEKNDVGNFIRSKIRWYIQNIKKEQV